MIFRVFSVLFALALIVGIGGALGATYMLWRLSSDLPSYEHLTQYEPPVTTRVHAGDGTLIAEYAKERRLFVPIEAIPKRVIDAFSPPRTRISTAIPASTPRASCARSSTTFST